MKATCKTKQLLQAIEITTRMSGKQLSLPLLQGILLICSGKSIKIRATNLSVGVEIEIPAIVLEEGTTLFKGEIMIPILQNSSADNLQIELDHENLKCTTISSKHLVKTLPLEDFPTLPIIEGDSFNIDTKIITEGIRGVFFASAQSDIKPEIASVFIYTDQQLIFVGTDSFRLAEKRIKVKNIPEINKLLIPSKSIPDILKVLEICNGDIKVIYNKNQLALIAPGIYFTTRLIDGAFPDYRLIFPKEIKTKVVLLKQELLNILKLSIVFVDKFSQIIFTVDPTSKKVVISSKNNDIGASENTLSAVIEGQPIETAFNLKYFIDVFQSISGDSVSIECMEANKPILIKSVNDTSFSYLLMPTNR